MIRILKSESGSIVVVAAAVVLSIVSAVSSWALVGMVSNAKIQSQYDHDAIQQEILLRSEADRTHIAIEHNSNKQPPPRTVFIDEEAGNRRTTYSITTKTEKRAITIYLGQATEQAIAVMSLITSKRGKPNSHASNSPVQRFSERLMRNQSLAQYQYFTDIEKSENDEGTDDLVKFWGPDVLNGPVHSNDDIWIQQGGGGNNGGWPTFHSEVTTAGRARRYPDGTPIKESGAPWEDIFLDGLLEEVDEIQEIVFEPNADDLRQNAYWITGHDIVYAKMNGNVIDLMYGDIINLGPHDFEVYSWYPHNTAVANAVVNAGGNWFEDSDNIWTNTVTLKDTMWSPGGTLGGGFNQAYWVEDAQLWIEGEVLGKMTWGCRDTIFIVDDITYSNTPVLGYPDGFSGYNPVTGEPEYNGPVNETDYFGLVSEQKILVRYKHRDPFEDNILRDGNCDGNVYLYGAFAAIGEGDEATYGIEACHYDGIFTFQYHHGHGSTPSFEALSPYTLQNTLYTYVDFHKFIFPRVGYVPPNIQDFKLHGNDPPFAGQDPACGFPYEDPNYIDSYPNDNPVNYAIPYGTDWPWYNPVWPEPETDIVWERGNLNIYGAIAQRRRGYIHRSGSDPFNHLDNNEWDISDYHYDGIHPSCGYDKQYSFDNRFRYVQPPYFPQVYQGWGEGVTKTFSKEAWVYKSPRDW